MNDNHTLTAFFAMKNRLQEETLSTTSVVINGSRQPRIGTNMELSTSGAIQTTQSSYKINVPEQNYFLGLYLTLVVGISILANFLAIIVMLLRKQKIRLTHMFIIVLAVSDFFFSILIHPMLIATSFGADTSTLFGTSGCNWYGFVAIFFGGLSMWIHGSIAYTRYMIIVHAEDQFWHKPKHNYYLLLVNISIAFSFALAPIVGWGRYETFEYGCTVAFHDPGLNMRSYVLSCLVLMLGIPLITCFYSYSRIICYSYQCKLKLFAYDDHEEEENDFSIDPMAGDQTDPEKDKRIDLLISQVDPQLLAALSIVERKLTRLTLTSALGFMIAWTPFVILCLWEMATPPTEIPSTFRVIACLFCKTATAYNPFIYFFMGKEFRQDCYVFFKRLWPFKGSSSTYPAHNDESLTGPTRVDLEQRVSKQASSPPPQQVNLTPNPMIDNYTIAAAAGMEEAIRLADRLHDMDQLKPKDDLMITETTFGQECKEEDQNTKSKQVVLK